MNPDFETMVKQMQKEIQVYPAKNRDHACADCGVYPPFQPTHFTWDDRSLEWKMNEPKENNDGWVTWSQIGAKVGWRQICPPCAKKRTMI